MRLPMDEITNGLNDQWMRWPMDEIQCIDEITNGWDDQWIRKSVL